MRKLAAEIAQGRREGVRPGILHGGQRRIARLAGCEGQHRVAGRRVAVDRDAGEGPRSEEHTSELQSLMRISYAVFCLKKKKKNDVHKTSISSKNTTKSL